MKKHTDILVAIVLLSIAVFHTGAIADEKSVGERKALFGELHIHTGWSFDAYIFRVRATPDDAYQFAKGEPLKHPLGQTYKLRRPLDFMAVTDHASYMGALPNMANPEHPFSKLELAKRALSSDQDVAINAFTEIGRSLSSGKPIKELLDPRIATSTWQRMIDSANRHNDPGRFTALIGYEWTSAPERENLHRNVIFAGADAPLPFSALDSAKPEDLWDWMDRVRNDGHRVLAIPHNSNISNGRMFAKKDSDERPLDAAYADQRMRNEPVVEITQVKGTSETHPSLSPNDEFANFELVEQLVATNVAVKTFAGGYARDAYRRGLEYQDTQAFNPFRFGVIGSTDSHTGIVPAIEREYSGKVGVADGSPKVRLAPPSGDNMDIRKFSSSGLAAVWARENTRGGIFNALRRKESWATTGPRIVLRFFAGWGLGAIDAKKPGWVAQAYASGVSMGGTLYGEAGASAPTFIVAAQKDADGANLDRLQIVKGWSENGVSAEKIYNIALSDQRRVNKKTGLAPAVGDTIDPTTLEYTNAIGAAQLSTTWTDPDFDATQNAFYYLRALEIPTPRWSSYDARTLGIDRPDDLPFSIQERAYTSPIWYEPAPASAETP